MLGLLSTPLFLITTVHGSDDQSGQENVNNQTRDDTVVQSNETAFVHSTVQQKGIENTYGLLLTSNNRTGVALHMESSDINDIHPVANPANPSIRITYKNLIEYSDTNGNGAYDPGQDTAIQSINLETKSYARPEIEPVVSQDGRQGYELISHTVENLFTVSTQVFPQTAQLDNTPVPPTVTTISISINTSQIQLNNTSTGLALETNVVSNQPFDGMTTPSSGSLSLKSGTTTEYFSWNPTSTVDNHPVKVKLAAQQACNNATISLSYPKGLIISHNMVLGVIFGTTPLLTTSLLIGASIAALVLFGLLFASGKRQYSRAYLGRSGF